MKSKHIRSSMRLMAGVLILLASLAASAALAAPATQAELHGVTLNSANPYWANSGSGSASDWNVFFDVSTPTPTLRLKSAIIHTPAGTGELLYVDGDVIIALEGANTIAYSGSYTYPTGLFVNGALTIADSPASGTGSLTISIESAGTLANVHGITANGIITVESGILSVDTVSAANSTGLTSGSEVRVTGGSMSVGGSGILHNTIYSGQFVMTGGTVDATATASNPASAALNTTGVNITGGDGTFSSTGSGHGALVHIIDANDFQVLGGHAVFIGAGDGLYFDLPGDVVPTTNQQIRVATNTSGSGKTIWSAAMGILASNTSQASAFRYVEFGVQAVVPDTPNPPQTGDVRRPWLWLGVGLTTLLLAAGAYWMLRRHRLH